VGEQDVLIICVAMLVPAVALQRQTAVILF